MHEDEFNSLPPRTGSKDKFDSVSERAVVLFAMIFLSCWCFWLKAATLSSLWLWFLAPLTSVQISIYQATGIVLLLYVKRVHDITTKDIGVEAPDKADVVAALFVQAVLLAMTYLIGFIIHWLH